MADKRLETNPHVRAHCGKLLTLLSGSTNDQKTDLNHAIHSLSNHRFLDTNSDDVRRIYTGLGERFRIHSQPRRSAELMALFDEFAQMDIAHDSDMAPIDMQYACLLFVHLLANDTHFDISSNEQKRVGSRAKAAATKALVVELTHEEREEFDWFGLSDADSMDEEGDESEGFSDEGVEASDYSIGHMTRDSAYCTQETSVPRSIVNEKVRCSYDAAKGYWHGNHGSRQMYPMDTLAGVLQNVKALDTSIIVAEDSVVKECFLALYGLPTCIFVLDDQSQRYTLNSEVTLTHLSPASFRNALKDIVTLANQLLFLRSLCKTLTEASSFSVGRVLRAMASSLSVYIRELQAMFAAFEDESGHHTWSRPRTTVSRLNQVLRPYQREVAGVYAALQASGAVHGDGSTGLRTSLLLSVLYKSAIAAGDPIICRLFCDSFIPYADFIDEWCKYGVVHDISREFFIAREGKHQNTTEWDDICTTREASSIPEFLVPVQQDITVAGQCVAYTVAGLVQHGQDVLYAAETVAGEQKSESLCHKVSSLLSNSAAASPLLKLASMKETEFVADNATWLDSRLCAKMNLFEQTKWILTPKSITPTSDTDTDENRSVPEQPITISRRHTHGGSLNGPEFMRLVTEHVHQCRKFTTDALMRMARPLCVQYFTIISKVFLMEEDGEMQDCWSRVFELIHRQGGILNAQHGLELNSALAGIDGGSHLSIRVLDHTSGLSRSSKPLSTFDSIRCDLEGDQPANALFDHSNMEIYNRVLRLLLFIAYVRWNLIRVRSLPLDGRHLLRSEERQLCTHQIFISHAKYLHFTNALLSYVLTRVSYGSTDNFKQLVSEAEDMDTLIAAHKSFVHRLSEKSLMVATGNTSSGHTVTVIYKMLNTALTFAEAWGPLRNASTVANYRRLVSDIKVYEEEYDKCNDFLRTRIYKAMARTISPHLEALAVSLYGSAQTAHI